jgi:hypothetical protein
MVAGQGKVIALGQAVLGLIDGIDFAPAHTRLGLVFFFAAISGMTADASF